METSHLYKSFNNNKSIEEMQYTIISETTIIENLKFELQFYKALLSKPIFKPHVMNLYERLVTFKNEINTINEYGVSLLSELSSHANQIRNKIECDNLACDNFFIKKQDTIEHKIFNFKAEIFNLKFRLFQYIESATIN